MNEQLMANHLPGRVYTDPAIYQEERERIFYTHWLCAGRAGDWPRPGSFRLVTIGRESILVVRDKAGRLHGFYNVCRHRGTRLCTEPAGQLDRATIQCPYHAWTYALDGRLVGAPHMEEDPAFNRAGYPLHAVALEECAGFVFLNLAGRPEPFAHRLTPFFNKFVDWQLDTLQVGGRIEYTVAANWKIIYENYNECYHCPLIHPALAARTPYRGGENDLDSGPIVGGPMQLSEGQGSLTMSGAACAAPIGTVSGLDLRRIYYYAVFPNLLLSLHPDYVMVHRLFPAGPHRTNITCDWLFGPEAFGRPGFNPQDAIEFWDMTNRQDWDICELTHQGVSSRAYIPGPLSPLEPLPAAFATHYRQVMDY